MQKKNFENVEYDLNWKSLNYKSGTLTVDETKVSISATIVSLAYSFWVQLGKLSMPCAAPKRAPIKDPLATFSPPKYCEVSCRWDAVLVIEGNIVDNEDDISREYVSR